MDSASGSKKSGEMPVLRKSHEDDEVEEEKGRIYSRMQLRFGNHPVSSLQTTHFLLEELAVTRVWLRNVSHAVLAIDGKINGIEGNKQTDVPAAENGGNETPPDDHGAAPK